MGPLISSLTWTPQSSSTIARENSKAVPGPRLVIILLSFTTLASEYLYPGKEIQNIFDWAKHSLLSWYKQIYTFQLIFDARVRGYFCAWLYSVGFQRDWGCAYCPNEFTMLSLLHEQCLYFGRLNIDGSLILSCTKKILSWIYVAQWHIL